MYNVWWQKSLKGLLSNPISTLTDYYQSNYELELLAKIKPLYYLVPRISRLPLGWVRWMMTLPIDQIPFIGRTLSWFYSSVLDKIAQTPLLNMFYYPADADPEMVRLHLSDGLEDLGPQLLEQLGNALKDREASAYYHLQQPESLFKYRVARSNSKLPILFVAGGKDRLANAEMIYQDGYLPTRSDEKQFLKVENFGHLDIVTGIHAPREVMTPIAKWLHERCWIQ